MANEQARNYMHNLLRSMQPFDQALFI